MPSQKPSLEQEIIRLEDICQAYSMAGQGLAVLDKVSLTIRRGESCAIVGASGSGKSTLLNILGLLDQPASGSIMLNGHDMARADSDKRASFRNQMIGFVFQSYNLLPRLSALDNVALPLLYRGCSRVQAMQRARVQLERFGLGKRSSHRPAELSGGQKQRVAIARALVGDPVLILADEPTGNLDSAATREVMDILLRLSRTEGVTLVMVTHDDNLARELDRCLHVHDGRIIETSRHRAANNE
ncbi:MAG: ABC transporter ATP-binding protein [Betaproteobacteria bacterium]|nr:ABC transporter ATP-binding protein [Betaproteobacteria bacterium]